MKHVFVTGFTVICSIYVYVFMFMYLFNKNHQLKNHLSKLPNKLISHN